MRVLILFNLFIGSLFAHGNGHMHFLGSMHIETLLPFLSLVAVAFLLYKLYIDKFKRDN